MHLGAASGVISGGKALDGQGGGSLPTPTKPRMPLYLCPGSETVGDKLHGRIGKQPIPPVKAPK